MMGKRRSDSVAVLPDRPPARPVPDAGSLQVTAMLHPSDADLSHPMAVRDGHGAPVTCVACGCRLTRDGEVWFHFNPLGGRDARGCRIACADAAHDAAGRAVSLAV
jgi:hypothetical protein